MNSLAWMVITGEKRYVAKSVPYYQRSSFDAGLAAAEHLQAQGFDSGCPIRSIDGRLSVHIGDRVLGLLSFLPGRELDPRDDIDQQWWGDRLGAAHLALAGFTHPGLPAWHWIRPDAAHLGLQGWIRPSVLDAALPVLLRFRWAVQADYFAARVVGDPSADNLAGLDHARERLTDVSA